MVEELPDNKKLSRRSFFKRSVDGVASATMTAATLEGAYVSGQFSEATGVLRDIDSNAGGIQPTDGDDRELAMRTVTAHRDANVSISKLAPIGVAAALGAVRIVDEYNKKCDNAPAAGDAPSVDRREFLKSATELAAAVSTVGAGSYAVFSAGQGIEAKEINASLPVGEQYVPLHKRLQQDRKEKLTDAGRAALFAGGSAALWIAEEAARKEKQERSPNKKDAANSR